MKNDIGIAIAALIGWGGLMAVVFWVALHHKSREIYCPPGTAYVARIEMCIPGAILPKRVN